MFLNCNHYKKYGNKPYCPFSFCCDLECIHTKIDHNKYIKLENEYSLLQIQSDNYDNEIDDLEQENKQLTDDNDDLLECICNIFKNNNLNLNDNMDLIPYKYFKYVRKHID